MHQAIVAVLCFVMGAYVVVCALVAIVITFWLLDQENHPVNPGPTVPPYLGNQTNLLALQGMENTTSSLQWLCVAVIVGHAVLGVAILRHPFALWCKGVNVESEETTPLLTQKIGE